MKNKNLLFALAGLILVAVIVSVVMAVMGEDDEDTNENVAATQDTVGSDTENLSDIYAKFPDFDIVLNKSGITEEQRENAIRNTRTFIALCDEIYGSIERASGLEASQLYSIGRLLHNDNYTHPQALFCARITAPPSYFGTYKYDNQLVSLEYNEQGETSIYDVWEEIEAFPEYGYDTSRYIQYIGF